MISSGLLKSTPFRVALILGATFFVAMLIAGVAAFELISRELESRMDQTIGDTFRVITESDGDSDQADLIDSVTSHSRSTLNHDQIYGLISDTSAPLAGDVRTFPSTNGWTVRTGQELGLADDPSENFRVFVGPAGLNRLLVGSSFAETREVGRLALIMLICAGVLTFLIVVGVGAALATRAQQRIDGIAATMARVGQGELGARIPPGRRNDDIDHLTRQVNAALDRLSALVEGMRQVSVNIAHDLKTPLNRLAISVESATFASDRGEKVSDQLAQVEFEIHRINSTFDALLRIAQIEAGARRARFVRIRMGDILDRIADAYGDVADEEHRTLLVRHPDVMPDIEGDQELLIQLSANLIENSIRHCPPGTLIEVTGTVQNSQVILKFADNGPGIPLEEHDKVFQRLYRLEKSRTTPGSGLGLSLVRAIADLHGASIVVGDRAPGLIVTVAFPVAGVV
jgi:signal transduction histidine kinase